MREVVHDPRKRESCSRSSLGTEIQHYKPVVGFCFDLTSGLASCAQISGPRGFTAHAACERAISTSSPANLCIPIQEWRTAQTRSSDKPGPVERPRQWFGQPFVAREVNVDFGGKYSRLGEHTPLTAHRVSKNEHCLSVIGNRNATSKL